MLRGVLFLTMMLIGISSLCVGARAQDRLTDLGAAAGAGLGAGILTPLGPGGQALGAGAGAGAVYGMDKIVRNGVDNYFNNQNQTFVDTHGGTLTQDGKVFKPQDTTQVKPQNPGAWAPRFDSKW